MKQILVIILVLLAFVSRAEQKPLLLDSSKVGVRMIPSDELKKYKGQDDFNYKENAEGLSAWDRFWKWIWDTIDRAMSRKGVRKGIDIFVWALAILLVVIAVYKLMGMEKRNFFRTPEKKDILFRPAEEDVRNMDLPAAIAKAEQEGDHRLALRLQYLYSLRQLSDKRLIDYAINKTNHDYARELSGTPYAASFSRITLLYEFGWYGEFPVDKDMYLRIREIFQEHQKSVQS